MDETVINIDKWHSGFSNYVIAGGDTICSLFTAFLKKHNWDNIFNEEQYRIFLHNSIDRFLFSFGTGLNYKTQKIHHKHTQKIVDTVDFIRESKFMGDSTLYIDSGGFQVAMGALKVEDMPRFINLYFDFLKNNVNKYQRAFAMDLPPGPNTSVFQSYQQIEDLNRQSYTLMKQLPQEVKDKILWIHHFRTPCLYDCWTKFLWEEDLADGFSNFSVGGLVANNATDLAIPIILYSIPISEIVLWCKQKGIKKFDFHVLGGANYIDIFYHNLFSHHIRKLYDIDCNITYDSSAIFKGLAVGRFAPMFRRDGVLVKADLRSSTLHLKFDKEKSIQDCVYERINEMAAAYGMKEIKPDVHPIYDEKRGTFERHIHMWLMMHIMRMYKDLEDYCKQYVQQVYPLYENGQLDEFRDACLEISSKFNEGKLSRKMQVKSSSVIKSLDVIKNIDREYNRHIIQKFMSADDISSMFDNGQLEF